MQELHKATLATRSCQPCAQAALSSGCYVAHGNLRDGIELPAIAKVLLFADFGGVAAPVMAEYEHGAGRVIVTTITLEFAGHDLIGSGATHLLTNLFSYALEATADDQQEADESDELPEGSGRVKRGPVVLRNKSGGFSKDGSGTKRIGGT